MGAAPGGGEGRAPPPLPRHIEDRLGRLEDRLGLEDHARAAAVRIVVGDLVAALRPIADVMDVDRNDAGLDGPLDDGIIEGAAENGRGKGEEIDGESYPNLAHIKVKAK